MKEGTGHGWGVQKKRDNVVRRTKRGMKQAKKNKLRCLLNIIIQSQKIAAAKCVFLCAREFAADWVLPYTCMMGIIMANNRNACYLMPNRECMFPLVGHVCPFIVSQLELKNNNYFKWLRTATEWKPERLHLSYRVFSFPLPPCPLKAVI